MPVSSGDSMNGGDFAGTGSDGTQGHGSIAGLPGMPAFSTAAITQTAVPVVISAPHAGRCYSPQLIANMREPEIARLRLEDRLVDMVARAVARQTGAALLIAHAPRAMIDLNRSPDDVDWGMVAGGSRAGGVPPMSIGRRARSGLGLVPRRLQGLGEIWKRQMAADDLEGRLAGVHRPYHTMLASIMENVRDQWGSVLLIDMHSMPPLQPQRGTDGLVDFPVDYVLGDRFGATCMAALPVRAIQHFSQAGCNAAYNRPYAGGYVLERHGMPGRGLHAMQLEICRSLYLDESRRNLAPGLGDVITVLIDLVRVLADQLRSSEGFAQAAE